MKKGTFTSSNAREMQIKASQKRKANNLERKSARAIVDVLLNTKKRNSKGEEITIKEAMMRTVLKGALEEGDLRKVEFLLKLIGEAPDNVSKIDVTTNGKDMTAPKIVFAPTPLSDKDMEEIRMIQNGEKSSDHTSVPEAGGSL